MWVTQHGNLSNVGHTIYVECNVIDIQKLQSKVVIIFNSVKLLVKKEPLSKSLVQCHCVI